MFYGANWNDSVMGLLPVSSWYHRCYCFYMGSQGNFKVQPKNFCYHMCDNSILCNYIHSAILLRNWPEKIGLATQSFSVSPYTPSATINIEYGKQPISILLVSNDTTLSCQSYHLVYIPHSLVFI